MPHRHLCLDFVLYTQFVIKEKNLKGWNGGRKNFKRNVKEKTVYNQHVLLNSTLVVLLSTENSILKP